MIFCYFDICKVLDTFNRYVIILLSLDKLHAIHYNLKLLDLSQHEDLISTGFIKKNEVTSTPQNKEHVKKFKPLKLFDNSKPKV